VLKLEKRGKNKIKNTLRAGLSINGGMVGGKGQECWKGGKGIGVHSQTVNEVYVELLAGNVCCLYWFSFASLFLLFCAALYFIFIVEIRWICNFVWDIRYRELVFGLTNSTEWKIV